MSKPHTLILRWLRHIVVFKISTPEKLAILFLYWVQLHLLQEVIITYSTLCVCETLVFPSIIKLQNMTTCFDCLNAWEQILLWNAQSVYFKINEKALNSIFTCHVISNLYYKSVERDIKLYKHLRYFYSFYGLNFYIFMSTCILKCYWSNLILQWLITLNSSTNPSKHQIFWWHLAILLTNKMYNMFIL